jgi:hypothetical protein
MLGQRRQADGAPTLVDARRVLRAFTRLGAIAFS